jgi:hypothetical protein
MGALSHRVRKLPHSTTDGPTPVKAMLDNPNGPRVSILLMRDGLNVNHNGRWTRKLNGEP